MTVEQRKLQLQGMCVVQNAAIHSNDEARGFGNTSQSNTEANEVTLCSLSSVIVYEKFFNVGRLFLFLSFSNVLTFPILLPSTPLDRIVDHERHSLMRIGVLAS